MLNQYRAVSVPTGEPHVASPVRDGETQPGRPGINPRAAFRHYVHYCRTKHVVPLNWSFYLKRFGLVEGIKRRRYWKKHGLKNAFRPLYFKHRDEIPPEFIRLDPWEMTYLMWAGSKARRGIVEVGRYNGGSTLIFAIINPDVPIYSIDIAPRDDERLRSVLAGEQAGENVHLLIGDSQHGQFEEVPDQGYDLLFIDGDHSYEGCLADLENWWPGLAAGGSLLLHDCYHGCPVQAATEDFLARNEAIRVRGHNIPAAHWLTAEGSIAHFVKP
jgi:predicted O-methyltransferase YrrM